MQVAKEKRPNEVLEPFSEPISFGCFDWIASLRRKSNRARLEGTYTEGRQNDPMFILG